jgi:hypothetical protein
MRNYVIYQFLLVCVIISSVCTVSGPRGLTDRDLIELQRCSLHDASSHENDGSKYLKYDQVVSVQDAAITVQQLSGAQAAQLRRNMQLEESQAKRLR